MRYLVLFSFLFVFFQFEARAEGNCPSGSYPIGGGSAGWEGCAPMGSGPSGAGSGGSPGAVWETRWGAIAIDAGVGTYGGIEGFSSKRSARKAAITECKKYGGKKCEVWVSYYNQCGAMASGDTFSATARGPDINETAQRAVNMCSKETRNCKPIYSGCSYPERVR
jgi:hypothetical protein